MCHSTKRGIRAKVCTKGITNEGDVNVTSTTNIRLDGGRKICKGKKHHKSSNKMLLDHTPSETLICHPPSTIEASDDEHGDEAIDITAREE
ncbi:hypothetical protein H5410_000869 [Solanum commersonii]|uniref:Uncharacterized protein n=1 Tax=Solanum commersonii TaxID=4109 RepID=A0A9J6AXE3_SOLCO|nr:hypothetical protein H5410_000869 [Solanum commersonii]